MDASINRQLNYRMVLFIRVQLPDFGAAAPLLETQSGCFMCGGFQVFSGTLLSEPHSFS